jgi:hypothetical protein
MHSEHPFSCQLPLLLLASLYSLWLHIWLASMCLCFMTKGLSFLEDPPVWLVNIWHLGRLWAFPTLSHIRGPGILLLYNLPPQLQVPHLWHPKDPLWFLGFPGENSFNVSLGINQVDLRGWISWWRSQLLETKGRMPGSYSPISAVVTGFSNVGASFIDWRWDMVERPSQVFWTERWG